jgi:hypothetical protein
VRARSERRDDVEEAGVASPVQTRPSLEGREGAPPRDDRDMSICATRSRYRVCDFDYPALPHKGNCALRSYPLKGEEERNWFLELLGRLLGPRKSRLHAAAILSMQLALVLLVSVSAGGMGQTADARPPVRGGRQGPRRHRDPCQRHRASLRARCGRGAHRDRAGRLGQADPRPVAEVTQRIFSKSSCRARPSPASRAGAGRICRSVVRAGGRRCHSRG